MPISRALFFAAVLMVGCSLSYKLGQKRPQIVGSTNSLTGSIACGWDDRNKCVAIWFSSPGGESSWMRVSPMTFKD